jgi:adenine-specific DNA-methyltransferase
MVDAIDPNVDDIWLDPCIGPGAFITPLRERGIPKTRIVGIDIDPLAGAEDSAATTIRGTDFFQWCAATKRRFTKIVANPPYVAVRKLHPQLQRRLLQFEEGNDSSFSLRSNYWCAFLSASLRLLEDHGSVSFVLPAAWEYALYADDLRRAILDNFRSVNVHRCHEPLFPPVREGRIVLVAKGYRQKPKKALRIEHSTSESLISALAKIDSGVVHSPKQNPSDGTSEDVPFSELFSVNIGCVTGNTNYFLLTESQRLEHDLPVRALQPVLSKARHLGKSQIAKADWERLCSADERVWLFSPGARTLQSKAVRKYLRHGEQVCDLEAYKLKHRDPWYCVKDIREGMGFLSGMTKLGPWICFRSMRHLAATNTLYVLTAKVKMKADERAAWALSLLSSPCRQQFKRLARRYPDGLPKIEPHDLYAFKLKPPDQTGDACQKYKQAIDFLLSGDAETAVAIADAFMGLKCR